MDHNNRTKKKDEPTKEPTPKNNNLIDAASFGVSQVDTQHYSLLKHQYEHRRIRMQVFQPAQTALVDNMIYEDKHMELLNNFYNLDLYRIELSSGTFIGTHGQLMTKKASILKVLQQVSPLIHLL